MPPSVRATCAAANTPATGPDSSIRTGKREAVSTVVTPPDESITYMSCRYPSWLNPARSRSW